MKIALILLICLFTKGLFAQSANLLFKIDNQYIFADTSGNIAFGQRFDYIYGVLRGVGEYIVRSKDKYGVVRGNQIVFPFEYDQVTSMHSGYKFHLYTLYRENRYALATPDGVIHTGFDYWSINDYYLDYSSEKKGIDKEGGFFELKAAGRSRLIYISKSNKSVMLTKEPVDGIRDAGGMFVFQKGKQEAMFEFDKITAALKPVHPYAEQSFYLSESFYTIWNPIKKTTKKYSYDHVLLESFPGPVFYDELLIGPDVRVDDGTDAVERAIPPVNLERARLELKKGYSGYVFDAFKKSDMPPSLISEFLKYHAEFVISGEKGDWLVESHFRKNPAKVNQKDTSFHVAADKIVEPEFGTSVIIAKTGKLYGAVDSRGNELFYPQFNVLERLGGEDGDDWLLGKTGKESFLYFYNPVRRKAEFVLKGENKDEFEIHSDYILVKRPAGKNRYQMKYVKWIPPFVTGEAVIFDKDEFYDEITPCESFPYFFNTSRDGKKGVLSSMGQEMILCKYDSIQLNAYFFPYFLGYREQPQYETLQPIFSAYLNGKQQIYHPTDNPYSNKLIHSFEDGSLNASAVISDDGLFVTEDLGNSTVKIYSIYGQLFTKEPISLHLDNRKKASYSGKYWYVRGTDSKNRDVLIGQNGAWFVLPDK